MFKIKRFRKIVMKYTNIYSDMPELIKQNPDYYISELRILIKNSNSQLEKSYILFEKICNVEANLSNKSMNIFWKFIQGFVDYLYNEILYSIEELDSCRISFVNFKLRADQIKIFHDKF